jgi:hypothetical protein
MRCPGVPSSDVRREGNSPAPTHAPRMIRRESTGRERAMEFSHGENDDWQRHHHAEDEQHFQWALCSVIFTHVPS